MAMKPWEEIRPAPLSFPIGGKTYVVPEMPYLDWLTLQAIQAGEIDEVAAEADDWRIVLGSALDEMRAGNVPATAIERAGLAAYVYVNFGQEMAEAVWEAGVDPKEILARVRANLKREILSTTSPSTGSANPTPTASTPRTTSPKKSAKTPRVVKSRS